jgi:hypothetical protein
VVLALSLLAHGCPWQAIVAAFGPDERTVAAWPARAGQHGQAVPGHVVVAGRMDLRYVQADELWVKLVGRRVGMALALAVPSRLGLGGVVSAPRDLRRITALVQMVRRRAATAAILVCVDGLASSVTAFGRVFRTPRRTGRRRRPRLIPEPGRLIGQVIKRDARRPVVRVGQRVVRGSAEAVGAVRAATPGGAPISTASIARLNATFRGPLAPLARRGRAIARTEAVLTAGMSLVGCADNLCRAHASLRRPAPAGRRLKWQV